MQQQIDYQAKQAAQLVLRNALSAANPHLVRDTGNSLVTAAKNIRIELKAAFPSIQFAVKTSRFSMGNSIDISWTDGPNNKQVEAITKRYQAGSFDGMTDCYNYEHSAFRGAFGEGKYVHTYRHYSDAAIQQVITQVCTRLGGMDAIPTVEDYRQGRLWTFKQSGGCDVEREINTGLSDIYWPN